jgi:NADH-quinone oxidoreductase subunit L
MALVGIVIAFRYYLQEPGRPEAMAAQYPTLYRALLYKYWVDELYEKAVVRPISSAARALSTSFDANMIDGSVNGIASLVGRAGGVLRRLQTGHVPTYVLSILVGVVVLLGYLVFVG